MIHARRLLCLALLMAAAACSSGPATTALDRGRTAFAKGDMATARVELLNALQANAEDSEARILQARVQLALGDGVAAEAELIKARQSGVPAGDIAPYLAHAKLLEGDPQAALREAARAGPDHQLYAQRIIGRAHMALGNPSAAADSFEQALAVDPNDGALWTDIGRFRRSQGDVAGAIEAIDRAVAASPRSAEALVQRGELTRGQYGLAAALPWFDRALEIDSANTNARLERAITYGDMGRMSEMLADTRLVLLSEPHPTAYYLLSVLAARGRDFELARLLYNRTGGAFDSTPAGMLLNGAIDYETGNAEQSARILTELIERQQGNRKARRLLAAALWRAGDARATAEALRPIADRPDADSYSLALIGRALARLNEPAAAYYLARAAQPQRALSALDPLNEADFARLDRAAAERPNDGPVQVRLISALLARGQRGEALDRARRLQAANPGVPDVHLVAGDVYEMGGDYAAAAEQYRRAANLAFTEPVALRLINALQQSGQGAAADGVLGLFLRQNPGNVAARFLLAGRYMEDGDWEGAIAVYEPLRQRLGDNDATILNNLAWAYSEAGDYEQAVPLARRAWALNRNNPATADTLGWLLFKSGTGRAEGLLLLQQASRGAPNEAAIRRRLDGARRASVNAAPAGPGSAPRAG